MPQENASTLSELQGKYDTLRESIAALDGAVVAFSGGVDSAVLLKVAHEALGENVIAATVRSGFYPERETSAAAEFCEEEGIEHVIVDVDELTIPGIAENPPDRCYLCKSNLLGRLFELAAERGLGHVLEGSNADDLGDYRPGRRAVEELGAESPLLDHGFTKDDVRLLALSLGLDCWDKPSTACLASRFAYGEGLTAERLAMVDEAERLLSEAGFEQLRVRVHGDLARIEVPTDELGDLLDFSVRTGYPARLHELGFAFVTMDLEGFKSGSMNATL